MTLDVECVEAADLATRLVLEPPEQLPPELEARVHQEETRQTRERSRRAIPPYLAFFAFLAFAPIIGVRSWTSLLFVGLVMSGQILITYVNWKIRPVHVAFYIIYQVLTMFAFSRFAGPFVLTPVLACGILLSFTAIPFINDRPWIIIAWCIAAMMFPVLAESVGAAEQTWHLTSQGVLSYGSVFVHGSNLDEVTTIAGNIALVTLIGLFAHGIARDRRIAQRTVFTQAWHLEQLIPKQGARTVP